MLPEKSQGKVLQATVVAVGPGSVNQVITYSQPGTLAYSLGKKKHKRCRQSFSEECGVLQLLFGAEDSCVTFGLYFLER